MSKNETTSSKEWVPIITAIIGVIGTIAIAYFSYRGVVAPKELEISATQTAEISRVTQLANILETPTLQLENIATSVATNEPIPQEIKGYMLFFDGTLVSTSEAAEWTCKQALENLLWNVKQYPEKEVEGRFDGKKIEITSTGYELFFDCERVGHEPDWTREQAIENLLQNIKRYPEKEVVGLFNAVQIIP